MVMAIVLKRSPFRCNRGEVKVVLGREGCEDHAELPHVRVALEFHVCFKWRMQLMHGTVVLCDR